MYEIQSLSARSRSWNVHHLRKIDCKIFADGHYMYVYVRKIGLLENFQVYGTYTYSVCACIWLLLHGPHAHKIWELQLMFHVTMSDKQVELVCVCVLTVRVKHRNRLICGNLMTIIIVICQSFRGGRKISPLPPNYIVCTHSLPQKDKAS